MLWIPPFGSRATARAIRGGVVGAAAIWLVHGACGVARAEVVSSTQALVQALVHAGPGADIALSPGSYDNVVIDNFHGSAKIHSASQNHRATFSSLTVRKSSGLTLSGLDFSTEDAPLGASLAMHVIPFKVLNSSDIAFRNILVHGSPTGSLEADTSGMLIRDSTHVIVADSEFRNLHTALDLIDDEFLAITGNRFHNNRDDGIDAAGSSNVLIADNHCESNHPDGAADTDHPDCIQFWTRRTTTIAHDIAIVGNVYERGTGGATQGIFMRDEVGTMPFRNVVIRGNIVKGSQAGAIEVWGATGVDVVGNLVCSEGGQRAAIILRVVTRGRLERNRSPEISVTGSDKIVDHANDRTNSCTIDDMIKKAAAVPPPANDNPVANH
jgi:parallel beta-helix repeat protein